MYSGLLAGVHLTAVGVTDFPKLIAVFFSKLVNCFFRFAYRKFKSLVLPKSFGQYVSCDRGFELQPAFSFLQLTLACF